MNSHAEPFLLTCPDGTEVPVSIRVSDRCRRVRLSALPDGIELVYPARSSRESALLFAQENVDWIQRMLHRISKRNQQTGPFPPETLALAFTGVQYRIVLKELDVCWTGVRTLDEQTLIVSGRLSETEQIKSALRGWLIRESERVLFPFAAEIAESHQITVAKYRTGIQKRTWGTCTSQGVVTLNAALLFFRPAVVRYVILHEFAHRFEMNHSSRFWRIVEGWCPGAKAFREEMKLSSRQIPFWLNE